MADVQPSSASNENQVVINAARSRDDGERAVIATDGAGTILYWNESAEAMYGWPAADALGKNILDVTPTRGSGEAAAQIMEDMRNGNEWEGDFIVRHRNGTPMIARIQNSVVRSGDSVVGVIGVSGRSPRETPSD